MLRKQLAMVVIAGIFAMSAVSVHCPDLMQKRKELGQAERYLKTARMRRLKERGLVTLEGEVPSLT